MKTQVVLISGKQGSGKTTLSNGLVEALHIYPKVSARQLFFAEPLYAMHNFCWGYLKDHGIKMPFKKDGYLLQLLGTEWGRQKVSDSLWVDLLRARIEKQQQLVPAGVENLVILVSDCRFINEIEGLNGLRIRLECNRDLRKVRAEMWRETETHASETELDNYDGWDLVVDSESHNPDGCVSMVMHKILSEIQ